MKVQAMKPSTQALALDSGTLRRRPLGAYLGDAGKLTEDEIARVTACQQERGLRFGEAAVALRVVTERDVRAALAAQFDYPFGVDGADPELAVAADPFGAQAEAFRELRSRLLLEALPESAPFTLAVLSAHAGEGRTYVAANLAAAFSQLGNRTLLIDADLRSARLDRLFRAEGGTGLSHVLAGFADAEHALERVPSLGHLWFMPAGALPPNPLELLQRPAFETLLAAMKEKFDRVILDTTAASRGADCRVVAARCSASLVVARRDATRMEALERLVEAIERGPARIAGVVMNER
jgi:chain length determinant protein tyrosine kinase EpsG